MPESGSHSGHSSTSSAAFQSGQAQPLSSADSTEGCNTQSHELRPESKVSQVTSDRSNADHEGKSASATMSDTLPTGGSAPVPTVGPSHASHLPTPRSPSNVVAYFPGVTSPQSPLSYAPQRNLTGVLVPAALSQRHPRAQSPHTNLHSLSKLAQMATPESSPIALSKRPSSDIPITPRPHSAPFGSSSTFGSHYVRVKPESPPPSGLAPAHIISPPMSFLSVSPESSRSRYSSPFMAKLQLIDKDSLGQVDAPERSRTEPATPVHHSRPEDSNDIFSPVQIPDKPSDSDAANRSYIENLAHSKDGRLPGGEIDRIRAHLLSLRNARALDLETRRPDYLKRYKHTMEDNDELAAAERASHDANSLGITVSPQKGRRLKLFDFKETSAESFEESLMTHGYGTYGEPRTPQRRISPEDGLSQEAIDWLTYNTPAGPSTSKIPLSEPEVELDERELRKRKRLDAFKRSIADGHQRLYPVEVEGKGRVLLNVPADEFEETFVGSPSKKRAVGRKRKVLGEKKGKVSAKVVPSPDVEEPKWLDQEFPWCLREKEREEMSRTEEFERLKWIERFLDRDTDSDNEDEDIDEDILTPSTLGQIHENPPLPSRKGRGKMVPLRADPTVSPQGATPRRTTFFPSDPADARAALLSRRAVRGLAYRRQRGQEGNYYRGNDDEVLCFCGNIMNEGQLVQCDECSVWYHLHCVGIQDVKDLGDEDTPWYCPKCWQGFNLESSEPPSPVPVPREPTLVPTDDRPLSITHRDVAFYQSSPHTSPLRSWDSTGPPQTPNRGGTQFRDLLSSRSNWDDSSRAGPSTPYSSSRNVRVYTTSGGRFDEYGDEETSFDPTSTPSRGITLGIPFVTPKSNWPERTNSLFVSPRNGGGGLSRNPFFPSSDDSGGPSSQYRNIYSNDDTPIRRAPTADARHVFDSPLASRSTGTLFPGLDDSPVVRSKVKDEENGRTLLTQSMNVLDGG